MLPRPTKGVVFFLLSIVMEQKNTCVLVSEIWMLEDCLFAKADSTIVEIYTNEYYDLSKVRYI
jgi:hypothetical protein